MLSVIQYMLIFLNVVTNIVGVLSRERIRQLCGYSASDFLTLSNISSFFFCVPKIFNAHFLYTVSRNYYLKMEKGGGCLYLILVFHLFP